LIAGGMSIENLVTLIYLTLMT